MHTYFFNTGWTVLVGRFMFPRILRLFPDSELHIIPQAAHMSNLENPDTFNERLLVFLKHVAALKS